MTTARGHRFAAATLFAVGLSVAGVAIASSSSPSMAREKQAILDHQFATPLDAAPPAPKNPTDMPPQEAPQPRVELRRVSTTDLQVPVAPANFTPTTQWLDLVGGVQLTVYGGSAVQQGGAAAIYVWISDLTKGRDLAGTGIFVDSALPGPLTLTSVSGGVATFRYPGGTGTFELATHEFRG